MSPVSAENGHGVDAGAVAAYLSAYLDIETLYTPVCIACGGAAIETAVLHELIALGFSFQMEIFMDRKFSSASVCAIDAYKKSKTHDDSSARLVRSFEELNAIIGGGAAKLLVFGIRAGMVFGSANELYAYHSFLCTCERLASTGLLVNADFLNFHGREGVHDGIHSTQLPGTTGTMVYKKSWWDMACSTITCTGAYYRLVGHEQTARD
jgi:hypothetical protein